MKPINKILTPLFGATLDTLYPRWSMPPGTPCLQGLTWTRFHAHVARNLSVPPPSWRHHGQNCGRGCHKRARGDELPPTCSLSLALLCINLCFLGHELPEQTFTRGLRLQTPWSHCGVRLLNSVINMASNESPIRHGTTKFTALSTTDVWRILFNI